jgi:lipopolysaccharide exporter
MQGTSLKFNFRLSVGRVSKSSFVRSLAVVMAGTAVGQAIGLAFAPIISRLFSPADFGIFGAFIALSNIIGAGVTLEYTQAIMLPREKRDAINVFVLSCFVSVCISALLLIACLAVPRVFLGLVKSQNGWLLGLLVLAALAGGINQACQAWCVRVKAFKQTSVSQVVRSISSSGVQIGLGLARGGAGGLVMGMVLAEIAATVNLVRVVRTHLNDLRSSISWARMLQLAREYRDFPMYAASQNMINYLSQGLPVLLLTNYFGIAVAGAYAFAMRILQAPMALILRALRQVLFQKAAEIHHHGQSLLALYAKTTLGLLVVAAIPSLILLIWAPALFAWVFGSQWRFAGEFARALVLWILVSSCNLPAVLFARLIRIQRAVFIYDLFLLVARCATLLIGGKLLTSLQTIWLFSMVGAAMNLFLILMVGYRVMRHGGDANAGQLKRSFVEALGVVVSPNNPQDDRGSTPEQADKQ